MPKMKTNRGAAKRFRKTGTGKIRHNRTNRRHLLTHKSAKRMRRLARKSEVTGGMRKHIEKLVPYL